jgi:hypothetical protein
MTVDWDAVAAWGQWAGAAGTTAAFVAAIKLLRVEHKRDRDERGRGLEQKRLADRVQADRVAAWPSEVRSDVNDPTSARQWGAAIRNGSDLPVYQLAVEFSGFTGPKYSAVICEVVPPGDWLLSGRELYRRPDVAERGPQSQDRQPREFLISVRFTDVAERRWYRDARGFLVRTEN